VIDQCTSRRMRSEGPSPPIGGCDDAREESPEDRTQACRPQEEAGEASRSRRPLRSRDAIAASDERWNSPVRAARRRRRPASRIASPDPDVDEREVAKAPKCPNLRGEAPPLKPIRDLIDQGQRKRDHGGEHEGEETDFHLDVKPGHYEITGSLIGGRVTRSAETWQFIRSVRVPPLERDGTTLYRSLWDRGLSDVRWKSVAAGDENAGPNR
jgi:hypothetical protein